MLLQRERERGREGIGGAREDGGTGGEREVRKERKIGGGQ